MTQFEDPARFRDPSFVDTHTAMPDMMTVTYQRDTSEDVPRWPGIIRTNGELIDALSRYPRENRVLINGDGNQIVCVEHESDELGERVIIRNNPIAQPGAWRDDY